MVALVSKLKNLKTKCSDVLLGIPPDRVVIYSLVSALGVLHLVLWHTPRESLVIGTSILTFGLSILLTEVCLRQVSGANRHTKEITWLLILLSLSALTPATLLIARTLLAALTVGVIHIGIGAYLPYAYFDFLDKFDEILFLVDGTGAFVRLAENTLTTSSMLVVSLIMVSFKERRASHRRGAMVLLPAMLAAPVWWSLKAWRVPDALTPLWLANQSFNSGHMLTLSIVSAAAFVAVSVTLRRTHVQVRETLSQKGVGLLVFALVTYYFWDASVNALAQSVTFHVIDPGGFQAY